MTIEKGHQWGRAAPLSADAITCVSDADAGRALAEARRRRQDTPTLVLTGGDLARTCGLRPRPGGAPAAGDDVVHLPCDAGEALVDGSLHHFVAHVVARRSWWRGPVLAVMNAQFIGRWDVAPRSHPNDGQLDVLQGDLSTGDRWKARSRLPSGTHVPHPGIRQSRTAADQFDLPPGASVWVDGVRVGSGRVLVVRLRPDALTAVV